MINLELFACAGGMAEGFRRAGIRFDVAIDFAADHCDSYERNLGNRPERINVLAQLAVMRRIRRGRPVADGPVAALARRLLSAQIDLLVADPPCTPWSRAGKRKGTDDDRDMLQVTCTLIAILRPRRYLIGNVPGLDDAVNLHIVQRTIGALAQRGYCVADFARLDAADYGVPQHRIRPFWFGHRSGPCWRVPAPTHCDPAIARALTLPGIQPLRPWVTCRDALGHLSGDALGRPVKMRRRSDHGHQKGSVVDRPARTVGTSNLSDVNNLALPRRDKHAPSAPSAPSKTIGARSRGNGACAIALPTRHERPVHTSNADEPARAITTQCRAPGHATTIVLAEPTSKHPAATPEEPSPTIRAGGGGHTGPHIMHPDAPSTTVQARENRKGSGSPVLDWPWPRPATTVTSRPGIGAPGHHYDSYLADADAVILSERAAAILQGFPESWVFVGKTKKARWSQIGQAMPIALARAVATAIVEQDALALGGD